MLQFYSASVRIANSTRAVDECIETAFEQGSSSQCGIAIVNAAMGHKLDAVAAAIQERLPGVVVLGTSCGGIVGREGAGEAMTHLAMMLIGGEANEYGYATVDDIRGQNAYEKGLELARALKEQQPEAKILYLLCPGMDIACDLVIRAFDEVFGKDVLIFGGTSADNYKAVTTLQYMGDHVTEHGAWAVAFSDKTLKAASKATHGFTAYGAPMRVTKASGNIVYEIDNMPAWKAYSQRLNLIPDGDPRMELIAAGALASRLPDEAAAEYGNAHILRGALTRASEGAMYMSISVQTGDEFWLTTRDEALIFTEQEKALAYLRKELNGHTPVAVFQADCLARGRTLFNRVMKDELIGMMHDALSTDGIVPPWLGMYGFGEFCPLMGENTFHTYTTSLLVLYR